MGSSPRVGDVLSECLGLEPGDVDTAQRALMASAGHRANILDGRFRVIGVGAVLRNGTWWFTQDFLQPVASASSPATAAGELPRSTGGTTPSASPRPEPSTSAVAPAAALEAVAVPDDVVLLDATAPPDQAPAPKITLLSPDEVRSTSGWVAIAAVALPMPVLVLAARARRRSIETLRSDHGMVSVEVAPPGDGIERVADEPEVDSLRGALVHHLSMIDAWVSTLDDRWSVLTESDRRTAVQVIRRNTREALGMHSLA